MHWHGILMVINAGYAQLKCQVELMHGDPGALGLGLSVVELLCNWFVRPQGPFLSAY